MSLDNDLTLLARAPLLNILGREALRLLAFAAESRSFYKGDTVFMKGARSDGGYVLTQGSLAFEDSDDGEFLETIAQPGSLIGRTALFIRMEWPMTARAQENTTLIRISPRLMRRVFDECPDAALAMHQAMSKDLLLLTRDLSRIGEKLSALDHA